MIEGRTHKLVLYNDHIHDFGYVMASLIKCCDHEPLQAEQCVVIADNLGKCTVKEGTILDMLNMKINLEKLELVTEIEQYESYMH